MAPSVSRCLRKPDRVFIESLKKEMIENPTSLVSPIVGLVRLGTSETFDSRHSQGYVYETIGGNNSRIALQELLKEHPDMGSLKTRLVAVYVGLSDEEALRVAAKHNRATSFTHSMTTQDKVLFVHCFVFFNEHDTFLIKQVAICRKRFNSSIEKSQWRKLCATMLCESVSSLPPLNIIQWNLLRERSLFRFDSSPTHYELGSSE